MTQYELAQMALRSEQFRMRVQYLMVKAALAKLNAADPPAADVLLGQAILDGKESVDQWAIGALTNPSIAAGAHAQDGSTISEGNLQFAGTVATGQVIVLTGVTITMPNA